MAGAAVMCRMVTEGVFYRKGGDSSANQSDFNLGCVPGLITFDRPFFFFTRCCHGGERDP